MTTQHARPREVAELLTRHKIPQLTIARLIGRSQPALCLYLNGKRGLTLDTEVALLKVLRFLSELAEESKVPVDFSNIKKLRPLWLQHLRLESEAQLIELVDEQQAL